MGAYDRSSALIMVAIFFFLTFLVLFVLIPIGAVFHRVQDFSAIMDPVLLSIAGKTVWQAAWSTFFSMLIGLPLGLWVGKYRLRLAEAFLAIPFGIPTVVSAMTWILWLGRSGILGLDWAYRLSAVIVAHVFLNVPWVALRVAQARQDVSREHIQAAMTLSAGRWRVFQSVIWPHVKWAWVSAGSQVFSLCAMSFAVVLILGGGPPVQTLETAIYSRLRYGTIDLSGAAAVGILQLLLTWVPWVLVLSLQSRSLKLKKMKVPAEARTPAIWERALILGSCFLFVAPYFVVVSWSGFQSVIKSGNWMEVSHALRISFLIAILSGAGALLFAFLGILSLRMSKWVALLATLPSGISVLVLGLGFWLAYRKWFDPFSGSLWVMVAIQVVIFSPIAFRMFWSLAADRQHGLLEAAESLGASPARALREIEWPRWRPTVISAFLIVLTASLGEIGAVSLFYSERIVPMPLLISRWLSQYRFEEAQALASILFLLSALITVTIYLGRGNLERSTR